MERNRNWPAWGALILAGLALFVALGGRGNSFERRWAERDVVTAAASAASADAAAAAAAADAAALQAPRAPQAPHGIPFDREMQREMYGRGPGAEFRFEHGPMGRHEGFAMGGPRGWHGDGFRHGPWGGHGFFGPLALFFGLSKLIAVGLLAWLLLRMWSNRRGAAPATPAPTTPAGHDPRVE